MATWAATVAETILANVVPRAADYERAAGRAAGVRAVAMDVPFIDVVQSHFAGDGAGGMQSFRGRPGLIAQLEVRMKRREVQWDVRSEMRENPFGKGPRLGRCV